MALNRSDIDLAKWLISEAINSPFISYLPPARPWEAKAIDLNTLMTIQAFIEAVAEHMNHPTADVRSREWRRMIYSKLLDDPSALAQFTNQALEKFGIEALSQMVAPEIQESIVNRAISEITPQELADLLKEHDQLNDLLEVLADRDPEFLIETLGEHGSLEQTQDDAYNSGYQAGEEAGYSKGQNEGYETGYNTACGEISQGTRRWLEDSSPGDDPDA